MAWLNRVAQALLGKRGAGQVINLYGIVGGVALAVMMFLTGADVTLRYIFSSPITGAYQITQMMIVIYIAGGFALCAFQRGHIKVDLVINKLSPRAQAIFDCVTGFPCLVLFVLITWQSFQEMSFLIGFGQRFEVLPVQIYPFVGILGFGFVLLSLVLLANFLSSLSKAVKKSHD